MKYLKRFNEDKGMGIIYDLYHRFDNGELSHLLEYYFTDEIDELDWSLQDSHTSEGMQNSLEYKYLTKELSEKLINNTFMIDFYLESIDFWAKKPITTVMNKLQNQMKLFDENLKQFGLKIAFHEYGLGESSYEVFISDINFEFNI